MSENPYPQWIVVNRVKVENPAYRAWAEGYSLGFADGQVKATREALEDLDRISKEGG